MKLMRAGLTAVAIAITLLTLPSVGTAQQDTTTKKKTDVTGTWTFSVTTDAGTGTPTVTIKQSGDSLSGHYSSQTLGEHDFKGTIKDKLVTIKFSADLQGTALVVTYSGTVDGDGMKGTVDFSGMAGGTFTATRKK
jgi:hypothetical protein